MNSNFHKMSVIVLLAGALLSACAKSEGPAPAAAGTPAAATGQGPHTTFATAEEATEALVTAVRNNDAKAMGELFGPGMFEQLGSGDPVEDARERGRFVSAYDAGHTLVAGDSQDLVLLVGEDRWPLPIPLVHRDGRWSWDGPAGIQELLLRRVGADELRTIKVMRGYVDAQADYAATGHDGLPAGLYAQRLNSSPGKQDGLYWETPAGKPPSPAGPFLAAASSEGYNEKVRGCALPRLRVSAAHLARSAGAGRRPRLPGRWQAGQGLRAAGISVQLRFERRHDLHHQPGWRAVAARSRGGHGKGCAGDYPVQSRLGVDAACT